MRKRWPKRARRGLQRRATRVTIGRAGLPETELEPLNKRLAVKARDILVSAAQDRVETTSFVVWNLSSSIMLSQAKGVNAKLNKVRAYDELKQVRGHRIRPNARSHGDRAQEWA